VQASHTEQVIFGHYEWVHMARHVNPLIMTTLWCSKWPPFARTHAQSLLHHWLKAMSIMSWSRLHQIWISHYFSSSML